jgi:6-phosphogluconolactonase
MNIYIASYGKGEEKGIYIVDLDQAKLTLTCKRHVATPDFPSYMITDDNVLYVAYKNASAKNDGGGLGSFSIVHGDLILNNNYSSSGRSYTHLCISPDQRYIFAANYHIGATAAYALKHKLIDHKIGAVRHQGFGPDLLKRQTGPHVHNVGFTPDHKFLYAVDLGSDKIVMYRYQDGHLVADEKHSVNIIPGSGPRHMIFSKDGRYAYLVNEIANSVMVFKVNDDRFSLVQNVSCIPHHFKGFSAAAAIRMTSTGDHLMVSNRGHDSICLYRVNKESGKLSLLYMVHTGKGPRDFNIIDDQYLVVACQEDNKLQLMTFDETNEKLLMTPYECTIPQPVCVTLND